jgi:hypothetical protein
MQCCILGERCAGFSAHRRVDAANGSGKTGGIFLPGFIEETLFF